MNSNESSQRQKILDALPHLRRFAISLSGNRADGDDLLQSTVERVLKKGAPDDVDMKEWMFRICKNVWIDNIRSRNVRDKATESGDITIHNQPDGEQVIMDRLKLTQVTNAMQELPNDQRVALSLVAVEGYSYKDAAEILEIPVGTVMSRLARARAGLAAKLSPDPDDNPFTTSDAFRA